MGGCGSPSGRRPHCCPGHPRTAVRSGVKAPLGAVGRVLVSPWGVWLLFLTEGTFGAGQSNAGCISTPGDPPCTPKQPCQGTSPGLAASPGETSPCTCTLHAGSLPMWGDQPGEGHRATRSIGGVQGGLPVWSHAPALTGPPLPSLLSAHEGHPANMSWVNGAEGTWSLVGAKDLSGGCVLRLGTVAERTRWGPRSLTPRSLPPAPVGSVTTAITAGKVSSALLDGAHRRLAWGVAVPVPLATVRQGPTRVAVSRLVAPFPQPRASSAINVVVPTV